MNFDTLPPLLEQIKSGKLRALAVSTPKILPKLPNVTKFIEVGVQGFDVTNWYSIMCPKGMSQDIVNKLDKVIKTAMTDQSIKATLDSQGLQVCGPTNPESFQVFIKMELDKYSKLVKELNIKAE